MENSHCYKCQATIEGYEAQRSVPREEECPKCLTSLHCCKMCHFYSESSYNECREPISQRILDKEKSNFCDMFKLKSGQNKINTTDDLLSSANALFKN